MQLSEYERINRSLKGRALGAIIGIDYILPDASILLTSDAPMGKMNAISHQTISICYEDSIPPRCADIIKKHVTTLGFRVAFYENTNMHAAMACESYFLEWELHTGDWILHTKD